MLNDHFINPEVPAALEAAVLAGRAIMKIHGGELGTVYKKDDSPVTLADKEAHKAIADRLEKTGIPVLSEEMDHPEYHIRKQWERYWLVDPLDGTREFVSGGTDFTVNIALMHHGQPILGVILIPFTGAIYIGGPLVEGVYKQVLDLSEERSIQELEFPRLQPREAVGDIVVAVSRHHLSKRTLAYVKELGSKYGQDRIKLIRRGSAVKFCILAEGKAQFYPRYSPCMEWDTAAGQAICEAAGARMVRMEDHKPLDYNKKDLLNPAFLLSANGHF